MNSLAITPNRGKGTFPLSSDQIRRLAPSVFAERPFTSVSSRYSFAATSEVLSVFESAGWVPVQAKEQFVRLDTRSGFQKHELRFARLSDLNTQSFQVGDTRPELVLTNAHDGSSAYRIQGGLWRKICSNGLVVSEGGFQSIAIRHANQSPEVFAEAAEKVTAGIDRILDSVNQWEDVHLNEEQRTKFARQAMALRWEANTVISRCLRPELVLNPRRPSDAGTSLWKVFNVCQENLIKGGMPYVTDHLKRGKVREISGLDQALRVNTGLWQLADDYMKN
jgi:hypothetical protein